MQQTITNLLQPHKMNIQLLESKVNTLTLEKNDESLEKPQFSTSTVFSVDNLTIFLIKFNLKLKVNHERDLTIEYISMFEADEEITDRDSPFFSINAPAIAYPFLRAYVANFMLSSGFEPIILPTINFVKLSEKESNV